MSTNRPNQALLDEIARVAETESDDVVARIAQLWLQDGSDRTFRESVEALRPFMSPARGDDSQTSRPVLWQ